MPAMYSSASTSITMGTLSSRMSRPRVERFSREGDIGFLGPLIKSDQMRLWFRTGEFKAKSAGNSRLLASFSTPKSPVLGRKIAEHDLIRGSVSVVGVGSRIAA